MINEFVSNGFNADSTFFSNFVTVSVQKNTINKWQWKSLKEPSPPLVVHAYFTF
jgi:hypothetical protein